MLRFIAHRYVISLALFGGIALFFTGYNATPCRAQSASSPGSKPVIHPNDVEVKMIDRSVLKMTLLQDVIDLKTRFGLLQIPTTHIRSIRFGTRLPPDLQARINALIAQLGNEAFDKRETAARELERHKEFALPALQEVANDPDIEVSRRAKKVIASLRESLPADRLDIKLFDTIVTHEFTVTGMIERTEFTAKTPFFGEMKLKVEQMLSIRWLRNDDQKKFTLDVAKCGGPGEIWHETDLEIEAGVQLEIAASGTIDMYPTGGEVGVYLADPSGPRPNVRWSINRNNQGFLPGALIGRVGSSGTPFLIGPKYSQTMNQSGKLFLRVGSSPWNNAPAGSYEITATMGFR